MSFLNDYLGRKDTLIVRCAEASDAQRQYWDAVGSSVSADVVSLLAGPRAALSLVDAAESMIIRGYLTYRPGGVVLLGSGARAAFGFRGESGGHCREYSGYAGVGCITHRSPTCADADGTTAIAVWRDTPLTTAGGVRRTVSRIARMIAELRFRRCQRPSRAMLIGISASEGAGKSTLANALVSATGTPWQWAKCIALASAVKDALATMLPVASDYALHGPSLGRRLSPDMLTRGDSTASSTRTALEQLGTTFGRGVLGEDVWVRRVLRTCDAAVSERSGDGIIVIPDVRFPNEASAIHALGGYVIRVERPTAVSGSTHESNTCWRDIPPDDVVVNDGTLKQVNADMLRRVRLLFRSWHDKAQTKSAVENRLNERVPLDQ